MVVELVLVAVRTTVVVVQAMAIILVVAVLVEVGVSLSFVPFVLPFFHPSFLASSGCPPSLCVLVFLLPSIGTNRPIFLIRVVIIA